MDDASRPPLVLVTGATGYIGGLLVPALHERGLAVRVLSRSAGKLRARHAWVDRVEVVEGDAAQDRDLERALTGVDVAFYLLHSMDGHGDFVARDRTMAESFAAAARKAGVQRIVYLSGLHPDGELSAHLGSRVEVGEILLASGVPTIVLQAGVVLGAGSASFDMLRHLTERLPAMVAPKWLRNRIQPIAVTDMLHYLAAAAEVPGPVNRTFDVGGPDVLTYGEMLQGYARVTGLGRRTIVAVPVLTPNLASLWMGFVSPVPTGVARPLVGSLVHEAVGKEDDILELTGPPPGGRTGFDEAIREATRDVDPTRWRRTFRSVAALTAAGVMAGSILARSGSRRSSALPTAVGEPSAAAFPVVRTTVCTAFAVAATATITELEEGGRQVEADHFKAALVANLALGAVGSALSSRLRTLPLAAVLAGLSTASGADLARRAAVVGKGKAAVFGAYAGWSSAATLVNATDRRRNRGR